MLVSVQNVTKGFLDDTVLSGVSLDVGDEDRIGLLGVNGAGKTTLLNLIAGELAPDEGVVTRERGLRVGYLRQNDALDGSRTLQQEAEEALAHIGIIKEKMEDCAKALEQDAKSTELLARYSRLQMQYEAMDGYHVQDRINRVLNGLGFSSFDRNSLVGTLSGGEKMRFGIGKMLLQEPELLILDEPTNHLDFSMLEWLENYLQGYKGAVLTVSHDRYFLDAVARDVCEIERAKLTRYKGGYSGFVTQKAERRKTALRQWQVQQEEIAKMEEYVRKNLARSASASGVGTRVKMLEKMERLEKPAPEPKSIMLQFTFDLEPFSVVLQCENLGVSVGEAENARQLYTELNLTVRRGEKVALVGLNGVGKSTFLKAIQNQIPHDGLVRWGGNTRIGYFDQELAGLDLNATVLEAVHSRYPTKTEFMIRSALGKYLLEGDAVYKKVRELSGANRAKVAFAILEMHRANVLLLDEPTNHLDYRAKEALETALRMFDGTLLVVSHDRYFLRRVPSMILEMHPEGFESYPGNYDDYRQKKLEAKSAEAPAQPAAKVTESPKEGGGYRSKQQRAQDSQRRTKEAFLQKEMERLQESIEVHSAAVSAPENAADYELLTKESEALAEDNTELEAVMEEWILLSDEVAEN